MSDESTPMRVDSADEQPTEMWCAVHGIKWHRSEAGEWQAAIDPAAEVEQLERGIACVAECMPLPSMPPENI